MDKKKEIFICFSTSGGKGIAKSLYDELCKYQEYRPFFSPEEIRLGDIWREERDKALNDCDIFRLSQPTMHSFVKK
jgi:hypothetical protein